MDENEPLYERPIAVSYQQMRQQSSNYIEEKIDKMYGSIIKVQEQIETLLKSYELDRKEHNDMRGDIYGTNNIKGLIVRVQSLEETVNSLKRILWIAITGFVTTIVIVLANDFAGKYLK